MRCQDTKMIITERKHDKDEFLFSPVYLLIGDLETAKFYSNLASASAKFGTYLEKQIKEVVKLPIVESVKDINNVTEKSLLKKQRIDGVEPDFIVIDPVNKTISVCEVKSNLFNMDSKQCKTENDTGLKMKKYFSLNFSNYTTSVYLVNFFGFQPTKRGKHVTGLTSNFTHINGNEFSKLMDIDYDFIISSLKNNREMNREFIKEYKNKNIEGDHA